MSRPIKEELKDLLYLAPGGGHIRNILTWYSKVEDKAQLDKNDAELYDRVTAYIKIKKDAIAAASVVKNPEPRYPSEDDEGYAKRIAASKYWAQKAQEKADESLDDVQKKYKENANDSEETKRRKKKAASDAEIEVKKEEIKASEKKSSGGVSTGLIVAGVGVLVIGGIAILGSRD